MPPRGRAQGSNRTRGFTVTLNAPDIRPTLSAFSKLGKEANAELRQASTQIAQGMVPKVQAAADTKIRSKVARSVKVRRDRVPVVVMGGRGLAGTLVAGAEFGGSRVRTATYARRNRSGSGSHVVRNRHVTVQFGPHSGRDGWFFFPTFRDNEDQMMDAWRRAVDQLTAKWGAGG